MSLLDRFARAFRTTDLGASEPPGLAQQDDGTVIYIKPDGSRVEVGGGGSTPDGSVLPNATPTGATLDTTSYDDPANPGTKLATLVLPTNAPILAVAIEGDAFPRWVMYADATLGLFMGDGSYDPFNAGENALAAGLLLGDSLIVGKRPGTTLGFGTSDPGGKRPGYSDIDGGLQINTPAGNNGAMLASGHGAPAIGGEIGDIFIRTDPGGASETIYRCTVAGTAGNATWTGIL
jgi:hypothetical protein